MPVDSYVCGADVGGTKTECAVATQSGEVLARAAGRGVAFHGPAVRVGMLDGLTGAIADACRRADIDPQGLSQLVVGLAGVDNRHHELEAQRALGEWLPRTSIEVVNDACVALEAAIPERPAMIVIAGTGSIVYGEFDHGDGKRVGGWGHVFGDEGSAYAIAIAGLRAVLHQVDGRGGATSLTDAATKHFALDDPAAVVSLTERISADPALGASFAPDVFTAWLAGDPVAGQIVRVAANELGELALALLEALADRSQPRIGVALAGTVLVRQPQYASLVLETIRERAPHAVASPAEGTPVLGAVLRALRHSAGRADPAQLSKWRSRLLASFRDLDGTAAVAS